MFFNFITPLIEIPLSSNLYLCYCTPCDSICQMVSYYFLLSKMYCTNCGSKLPEESNICENCNTPVSIPQRPNTSSKTWLQFSGKILKSKKVISICLLIVIVLVSFFDFNLVDHIGGSKASDSAYFIGRVRKMHATGCIVEVIDNGNQNFYPGDSMVIITTNLKDCPNYFVGDCIRIEFDGKVDGSRIKNVLAIKEVE